MQNYIRQNLVHFQLVPREALSRTSRHFAERRFPFPRPSLTRHARLIKAWVPGLISETSIPRN